MKRLLVLLSVLLSLSGCGKDSGGSPGPGADLPPVGQPAPDGWIVQGRAVYQVDSDQTVAWIKFFKSFWPFPTAYAATGSTTVTYTNAASVSFTINVANFAAGSFTGDTLSLGHVDLATLDDNHLKICGVGNNQKCTTAAIRVYTTGSTAGFLNTSDTYGVPVYAGSLNPATAVGLNTAGAVQVQTVAIASNKNRLRFTDFPTPAYNVTSDFSNAGSGSYSMVFVVEYVLQ